MNRRFYFDRLFHCIFIAAALLMPVTAGAAEIVLNPGYIAGTVDVGTGAGSVKSISLSASGGGYSSSKSVSSNNYSMTVQGGDWNYSVSASALVRGASYYPYTNLNFSNRSFPVPIGETVTNDYSATGAVRFHLTITGDPYSSWYVYGYANKTASGGNEQTNSNSYTTSSYSPDKTWAMPVVPNEQVRIYAYVYVDGKGYSVWNNPSTYLYKDIAAGQTVDVYLDVEHIIDPPCYDCQPRPEYGTVQGTVNLDLTDPNAFSRHTVSGYYSSYIYSNPGSFTQQNVRTGARGYQMYSYFDNNMTYFRWPYATGYKSVPVYPDQTSFVDFNDSTGMLTGKLRLTGTLGNDTVNNYRLYSYGASSIYVQGTGWVSQPTNGGYSYAVKYGTDGNDIYRQFLTGGYWWPYRFQMSKYDYASGYYQSQSLTMYDYNYYYNGYSYPFSQPTIITPGSTTVQDRDICFGSLTIRFRDDSGGTMSNPQVWGSGVHYNAANQQDVTVSVNANHNIPNAAAPEVEVHGPPVTYSLSSRAVSQDGSNISFPAIGIALECGVRKCSDRKAPSIAMTSPSPELITNAQSVTVSGTTTDEYGIQDVTVNDSPADWWNTGNEHEVAFTYELALEPGRNHIRTFVENTECNSCFDERNVYVDRWIPTVTITAPGNGDIYTPGSTLPVSVDSADQGYGYTLTVYLDGNEIGRLDGPADADAPASVEYNGSIGPLSEGSHTIRAVAIDKAGNSAETTTTIVSNRPPTADAGPDQVVECASPNGTPVILDGSGSSDPDGDELTYAWTWQGGSASGVSPTVTLPHGTAEITLTVDDGKGKTATDIVNISIMDTTAPSLGVTVDKSTLWPPNHKYVTVLPSVTAQDACIEAPRIELVSVTSNEPDNGLGDGDTANDIVINADGTVSLRAERSGTGSGRVYTITYSATDLEGNTTTSSSTVVVPHDVKRM